MQEILELKWVQTKEEITEVANLAQIIWSQHYKTILEESQICYMLEHFQSFNAIEAQIEKDGYMYFLLMATDRIIGYTAIKKEEKKMFLSKLYILKEERRKGFGTKVFTLLEDMAKESELSSMWLTVNRYNEASIKVYEKNGFQVIRSQVTDIKEGFVMDDFVMEKSLIV